MKAALVPVLLVAIGCGAKADDQGPPASESAVEPVGSEVAVAASSDVSPVTSGSAPDHSEPDYSVKGPKDNPDPHIARQAALRDAAELGMIGLLNSGAGGDPNAPTAPWGRDDSLSSKDKLSARGNMWGDEIGDAFGAGGLGLSGIGECKGGCGRGEGIGLGNIGTLGHGAGTGTGQGFGSGSGRLGGAARTKPPSVRMGATSVSGRLPPEVIQRIVRQNFGRFRLCYENGLRNNPNLAGQVTVSFTIDKEGAVSAVTGKTDMSDAGVSSCVTKAFNGLSFPKPEGGVVKVTYPINFSPGDSSSSSSASSASSPSIAKPQAAPAEPVAPKKVAGPTIAGKALADVTALEIEKALRDAGYTDISSSSKPGSKAVVFSAKKGTRVFTLTFVPANAPADALTTNEKNRLSSEAKVFAGGGLFLAVESDDKAASQLLLDTIIKKP